MKLSRSEFLKLLAGTASMRAISANPLRLPIGIQLYTVRNDLTANYAPTLKKLVAMGYREVEGGMTSDGRLDFNGGKPRQFRKMLDEAGLRIPSCHFGVPANDAEWNNNIEIAHQLGLQFMLCAAPPKETNSLNAWKRSAGFFTHLGALCRAAGLQFAYHNHNAEFRMYDGVIAYDELLRSSDPELVQMEVDCFWMTFAGKDPVAYFQKYPGRFPLLHVKDLKPGYKPTTGDFKGNPFCEVGTGIIKWKRIFEAAKQGGVKHYYVEQDMWDRPSLESARISAEYLKKLQA